MIWFWRSPAKIGFILAAIPRVVSVSFPSCQVLPVRHRLPGGRQDPGDERPVGHGEEAGLLRRDGGVWPGTAWPLHPALHVLLHNQEEPHRLHPGDPAGPAHRPGNLLKVALCGLELKTLSD